MGTRWIWILAFVLMGVMTGSAQTDQTADLQDLLNSYRDPDDPAVSLYVWTPDGSYGVATGVRELGGIAATTADRFRIGSVSKTYTAVATLLQVDKGLLDLDAPIATYLDPAWIANIDGAADVTVAQLLAMTSGLYEYLQDDFYDAVDQQPTHSWTIPEILEQFVFDQPAQFEAGRAFEYTNTNYLLLQAIVESVTGQPLHEVVRQQILDPIGADDTYTQIQEQLSGAFVHGYEDLDGDGTLEDTFAINDGAGLGDGALIATAADVARFYEVLLVEQALLEDETLEAMLTDQSDQDYGYGIEVMVDPDYGMVIGHSGSVLGFTSDARYFVEEDVIVVLLYADTELDDSLIYEALDTVLDE